MNEDLAAVAEKVAAMRPMPLVSMPADQVLAVALILSACRTIDSLVESQENGEKLRVEMTARLIALVTDVCPELATLTSEYLTKAQVNNYDLPSFAEDGGFGG